MCAHLCVFSKEGRVMPHKYLARIWRGPLALIYNVVMCQSHQSSFMCCKEEKLSSFMLNWFKGSTEGVRSKNNLMVLCYPRDLSVHLDEEADLGRWANRQFFSPIRCSPSDFICPFFACIHFWDRAPCVTTSLCFVGNLYNYLEHQHASVCWEGVNVKGGILYIVFV